MTDRIRIKEYEQATQKVSIGGIKWARKWDVCVQCDSYEEALTLRARLAQPDQQFLQELHSMLQAVEDIVEQECSVSEYERHQAVLAEVVRRLEQAKA